MAPAVTRQAALYRRLGVRRGDRVVCALGNCPEHLAAMGAAWACGAAHVAAGLGATAQDVAWLVGRVEARVLLAGRTAAEVPGDLPAAVRATSPEARSKLWQARHDAYYAALAMRPGSKGWPTDVCVPISRLAECIAETKRDLAESTIPSALAGHVGDGNFHLIFMIDPEKPEEIAEASRLNDRMVARALAMEGTCTGEHGIGYGKMDFLIAEHGEAVAVMRSIKQALDPNDIMNPGKIVRI